MKATGSLSRNLDENSTSFVENSATFSMASLLELPAQIVLVVLLN